MKEKLNYLIVFFVGCLAMYLVISYFPITENITKLEKDVTVTDTGIADAVEKIYDSVLIVSTYNDDKLIASGTGFIYKKDNNKYYILTNHHVIDGGNKVTVTFTDGNIVETNIIGSDVYSDIAVLFIESKDELNVAELGSSESSRVGDTSFAVGAPLDDAYSWTVTRGIVSGKDRLVEVSTQNSSQSDYIMKVIQTDTAINSGNSGGPLCNANGEVIGITSMKLVSSGVEGMGFAIPIEDASKMADRIINDEEITYPYVGIAMVDGSKYKLTGVYISEVEENSPASKAGLKARDLVIAIDDKEVKNVAYLRYYLYQYNVNDKIKFKVNRDGEELIIEITLGSK